jgi:hypothetical protein
MRTFNFNISIAIDAVVPEPFLQFQLEAARAEDATPFQKQLVAKYDAACTAAYANNDEDQEKREAAMSAAADDFLMELLGNGFRYGLRHKALGMLKDSLLGGGVAPAEYIKREALKPTEEPVK